jgi:hypothetical protein
MMNKFVQNAFLAIFLIFFPLSSFQMQIPCGKSFFPCSPIEDKVSTPNRRAHGVPIHSSPGIEVYPNKINDQMLKTAAREAHEETEVLYNESGAKPMDSSENYKKK